MDLQEEQPWDNNIEASDGIPVLASDSEESVIFVTERAVPSVTVFMHCCQGCHPCPAYLFRFGT